MASITERSGRWWVRWRDSDGTNRSITVTSRKAAERVKIEIEDAVALRGTWEPERPVEATRLGVVLAAYVQDAIRRDAVRTSRRKAQMLQMFLRWVERDGLKGVDVLSLRLLEEYHDYSSNPETGRHLHRRSAETVRRLVEAVELAWRWAASPGRDYVGVPPPASMGLVRVRAPRRRAPSWEDMDAMIAAAAGWHQRLYLVLRCTGLRVDEAMHLRWADVRTTQRGIYLTVHHGKTAGERGREVPMSPVLAWMIGPAGAPEEYLVPCPRAIREARARDAQRAWTRAGVDRAVWDGCAHHAFRRGFVSGLKRDGADDEAVEYLVGHSGGIRGIYVDAAALPLVYAVSRVPTFSIDVYTSCTRNPRKTARGGSKPRKAKSAPSESPTTSDRPRV